MSVFAEQITSSRKNALTKRFFLFPFQGDLNDSSVATAVPMTIFGVAALIGGLLSLTLPETVNKLLPDTIDEANDYTRDSCNTQQNAS